MNVDITGARIYFTKMCIRDRLLHDALDFVHRAAASQEIIEGKHDDLPESAFLFAGTIDDVLVK